MPGPFAEVREALKSRDRRIVLAALGQILENPDVRLVLPDVQEVVHAACLALADERARSPEGGVPKDLAFRTGPWALQLLRDLWEFVVRGGATPRRPFCLISPDHGRWAFQLLHALLGDSELGRSADALFAVLPPFELEDGSATTATECYLDLFDALWTYAERELRGRLPLTSELMGGGWNCAKASARPAGQEPPAVDAGGSDGDPCSIDRFVESLDRLDWMILHAPEEACAEAGGGPAGYPGEKIDVEALGEEVRSAIRELEEGLREYPDRWLLDDIEIRLRNGPERLGEAYPRYRTVSASLHQLIRKLMWLVPLHRALYGMHPVGVPGVMRHGLPGFALLRRRAAGREEFEAIVSRVGERLRFSAHLDMIPWESTHDAPEEDSGREDGPFRDVVGNCGSLTKAMRDAKAYAQEDGPVLILGETGTGKELFARAIHALSDRGRLEVMNCAEIVPSLALSTLFGHVEGAFTDAKRDRKGLFQRAHGGTLFLDEIGTLGEEVQAAVLRVVEDGVVRPVGGEEATVCSVRLIAATNREEGMKEDLRHRLNRFRIHLPPLRRRGTPDLLALVEHFIRELRRTADRHRRLRLDLAALPAVLWHNWPGNVRELRNALHAAAARADGDVVEPRHFRELGGEIHVATALIPASGRHWPPLPAGEDGEEDLLERIRKRRPMQGKPASPEDREELRAAVSALLDRAGWSKARLAREVDRSTKTIRDWVEPDPSE